ncbi:hypothetical protein FB45DRAFT_1008457 [Roridomyces roridus]|uniref:Uncharacterized protein n=1 Tax=Roridomyces roridus TaxID=1738132 RepID=A0AAD7FE16_9AGAR|nr:hypothetical protein FB45DRAFT_1008457 [Roridomyces roridus]
MNPRTRTQIRSTRDDWPQRRYEIGRLRRRPRRRLLGDQARVESIPSFVRETVEASERIEPLDIMKYACVINMKLRHSPEPEKSKMNQDNHHRNLVYFEQTNPRLGSIMATARRFLPPSSNMQSWTSTALSKGGFKPASAASEFKMRQAPEHLDSREDICRCRVVIFLRAREERGDQQMHWVHLKQQQYQLTNENQRALPAYGQLAGNHNANASRTRHQRGGMSYIGSAHRHQ